MENSANRKTIVQRKTISELTAEEVRQRILRGDYPEGMPLRQDALAAELGVSRIPIREAMRALEAEGLVTFNPHTGAVVSTLSLKEISELFELRALLEAELLREAVPRMCEEVLDRAEDVLNELDRAFERSTIAEWCALNWEFHSTLLGAADRPLTLNVLSMLHTQSDRYMRMQLRLMQAGIRSQQEHREILDAVRSGDAVAAAERLREHVRSAGRCLIAFLQERRSTAAGIAAI